MRLYFVNKVQVIRIYIYTDYLYLIYIYEYIYVEALEDLKVDAYPAFGALLTLLASKMDALSKRR
jgi:hypothetical protein